MANLFRISLCGGLGILGWCLANEARAATFGETGNGNNSTGNIVGELLGTQFVSSENGAINQMAVNVESGSGQGRVAIYADGVPNTPQALMAESFSQTITAGWNFFPIPEQTVSNGFTYWLILQTDNASVSFRYDTLDEFYDYKSRGAYRAFGNFPDPFPTPDNFLNHTRRYCIYATWIDPSATQTGTATPNISPTDTVTATPTENLMTLSPTLSATPTPTNIESPTTTSSFTCTPTPTPYRTLTRTATPTRIFTLPPSLTATPSPTPSATPTITLTPTPLLPAENLSQVIVFPNPWRADRQRAAMVEFRNLPEQVTLVFYTLDGRLIRKLLPGEDSDNHHTSNPGNNGRASWGLTDQGGKPVASGVYIFVIQDSRGNKTLGKIAVLR